jgi:dTDP-4-amino-4,6-dideoxygalactose transaminase
MAKTGVVKTIFKNILKPQGDNTLEPVEQLKETLEKYFSLRVFPVNSGRSAIYLILKSVGIGRGDEVIIQAYTCNAVPNPIIWAGAKPIYADIDPETLNIDPTLVEKKITAKTKAIILQHTLGRPGPIEDITKIAKEHRLLVIEDCAHCLGGKYKGKKLGTFGDAAILSFGREKVISSLTGGAILVRNSNLIKPIINNVSQLTSMPMKRTSQELLNFFTWRILLRRVYFNNTGHKLILGLNSQDFFNVVTAKKEKWGERPAWYPSAMPNILASIALEELTQLDEYNKNRHEIAQYYYDKLNNKDFKLLAPHEGIYLRVAAFHSKAAEVLAEARKRKFWFGNWYNTPVYPKGVDEGRLGYKVGSCPKAERIAAETINLPNYLGMDLDQAQEVVDFINNYK